MPAGVYIRTEAHKNSLSIAATRRGCSWLHTPEIHKKISVKNKGRKRTQEQKEKISKGHIGQIAWNKGKKIPKTSGENHWRWKGGYNNKLALNRNHAYKRRGAEGSHTHEEWTLLKKTLGNMCLCCRYKEPEITLTEDHIIPISKGGTNYIENIQPLCRSCNSRKGVLSINYLYEPIRTGI